MKVDMTSEELQHCFFNHLSVVYEKPNEEPTEYLYIAEIVYKRVQKNGKVIVSCGIVSKNETNIKKIKSIVYVRLRYLTPVYNSTEPMVTDFEVDAVIKQAFMDKTPVIVCEPDSGEIEYLQIDEIVIRLNDDNEADVYCKFYCRIESPDVPAEFVKRKEEHNDN